MNATAIGKNVVAAVLVGVISMAPSISQAQPLAPPAASAPKAAPKAAAPKAVPAAPAAPKPPTPAAPKAAPKPPPAAPKTDPKADPNAEAKADVKVEAKEKDSEQFAAGKVKFNAGDLAGGLADFQAADAAKPSPEIALYIGLCLDRLGKSTEALPAYERFLANPPASMGPAAKEIGERVAKIKAAAAEAPVASEEPTPAGPSAALAVVPATETPAATTPRSMMPAYITGGVAVAAAGVGAIFGILFLSDKSDFEKAPTTEKADSAEDKALIADIAFGTAITLGVASVLLFTSTDAPAAKDAPAANPAAPKAASLASRFKAAPLVTKHGGGISAVLQF